MLNDITKDIQQLPTFEKIEKKPILNRKQKIIALGLGALILLFLSKK